MKKTKIYLLIALTISGFSLFSAPGEIIRKTASIKAAIANPASVNCIKSGGELKIEKRNDGGEYGICVFPDGKECEEWALFRGECPIKGVDVSTYKTKEAKFCVITGGNYSPSGKNGTCTLKNGNKCDTVEYFNGKCPKKQ